MRSLVVALTVAVINGQNAADDPECLAFTGSYTETTITEIQSSYTESTSDGDCFPSTFDGEFVTVSGTVTAVGATKNSYTAGYFYMQECDDNSACGGFSAIEVFHEDHADNIAVGDIVEVSGYVSEGDGDTQLVACTYSKSGVATTPVAAVEISTSDLPLPYNPDTNPDGTACTADAEQYEHMLVKIVDPVVQCCAEAHGYVDGSSYDDRCQGNIDVDWAPVWDVYKQFYVTTAGETDSLVDIDNHMFSTFTKYYTRCEDDVNSADQFTSITGVVGWWGGGSRESPRWDVAPRDEFDIEGATEIDTSEVQTRTISEVKNAISPQIMFGNDFDAIPVELLGTNEVNSDGLQGTGCDGAGGTGLFTDGSCPRYDMRGLCEFYPQAICNCYPLNTYSSVSAHGSEYMFVEGIVNHVQDPTGPFYFEDACGAGNGIYVYRNDADQSVAVGDSVRVLGKAYHYYGLDELTDPIEVAILSTNNPICSPEVITAEPFQGGNGDCNREAELIEGARVKIERVTVTKIFNSLCMEDDPDVIASGIEFQDDWGSSYCPENCSNERCWGAFLSGYWDNALSSDLGFGDTYTAIEITDEDGNSMVLDQSTDQTTTPLTPYYLGTVPGYEGQTLQVGDTFTYVTGFVDHRRGSYNLEYGGYYALIAKEIGGWNEPFDDDSGGDKKKSSGLKGGALIGVIVVVVVVALCVGAVCLVLGAKYHRTVERNTQICKPVDDPGAKLELMAPGGESKGGETAANPQQAQPSV